MTKLHRRIQRRIQRNEYRQLQKHREAPPERTDILLLVQLHHLTAEFRLIVLVFLLQLLHQRLNPLHSPHRFVALVDQRPQHQLHQNRQQYDRKTVGSRQILQQIQKIQHRPAQRFHPPPVGQTNRALRTRRKTFHHLQILRPEIKLIFRRERFPRIDRYISVNSRNARQTVGTLPVIPDGRIHHPASRIEKRARHKKRNKILVGKRHPFQRIGCPRFLEFLLFCRRIHRRDLSSGRPAVLQQMHIAQIVVRQLLERRKRSRPHDHLRKLHPCHRRCGELHPALQNRGILHRPETLAQNHGKGSGKGPFHRKLALRNLLHRHSLRRNPGDQHRKRLESKGFPDKNRFLIFLLLRGPEMILQQNFIQHSGGVEEILGVPGGDRIAARCHRRSGFPRLLHHLPAGHGQRDGCRQLRR